MDLNAFIHTGNENNEIKYLTNISAPTVYIPFSAEVCLLDEART